MQKPATIAPRCITMAIGPSGCCETTHGEPESRSRETPGPQQPIRVFRGGHLYGESAFSAATTKVRVSVEMGGAETNCSGGVLKAQHVEWVVSNFGGLWD